MSFLQEFRTETKILLVVTLGAIILAVGGILLLKSMQPEPVAQTPPPTPTPSRQQEIPLPLGYPKTIKEQPMDIAFDGSISEWKTTPPVFSTYDGSTQDQEDRSPPKYQSGRDSTIWMGQIDNGLVLAGEVYGEDPQWPSGQFVPRTGEHLAVWISDGAYLELPPIGWGHQFGYEYLNSEEDCEQLGSSRDVEKTRKQKDECRQWFLEQAEYRKPFKKLFVRKYEATPNNVVENYATPVFDSLSDDMKDSLSLLRPTEVLPQMKTQAGNSDNVAYSFEFLIPWESLPPVSTLDVESFHILVHVCRANYSEAGCDWGHEREYGEIGPFSVVTIPQPRQYVLTSCNYDLQAVGVRLHEKGEKLFAVSIKPLSDSAKTYFFPNKDLNLQAVFAVDNPSTGYAYEPFGHSPIVAETKYFERKLGHNEFLCGPLMRYKNDGDVVESTGYIEDKRIVETKKLPNGDLLIKRGPIEEFSAYGSGQCGACPRVSLDFYYVDMQNEAIERIYNYYNLVGNEFNDIDIFVSDDWRTVSIYENRWNDDYINTTWNLTTLCYQGSSQSYQRCGEETSVPEPSPRNLTPGSY